MTEREIHTNDLQLIRQIVGIPQKRLDVPQRVVDLYELLRHAKHVSGQPGNLSDVELRLICLMADAIELPKPVVCKFGELTVGTQMWFRVNKFEVVECQFAGIHDATRRLYKIRLWGDVHSNIREDALSLEDPRDAINATWMKYAPRVEAPVVRSEDAEHEVAPPPPPTEEELSVREQRIDAAIKKLVERWPVGKRVDCCPPGEAAIVGTILGHDRSGSVKLAPDNAPAGSFAWVSAAHLYSVEPSLAPPPVVVAADPIEIGDDEDDGDDTGTVDYVALFPKGTPVSAVDKSGETFAGTVQGHGSKKMAGLMQVKRSDGSGKFAWVKCDSVVAAELAGVAN